MKFINCIVVAILAFIIQSVELRAAQNGVPVSQPRIPMQNHLDWDFQSESCGKVAIFSYPAPISNTENIDNIRVVYIEDDKVHPIEVRYKMRDGRQTIWVDRNRDGWFDEKFYNPSEFIKKYPTYCAARIVRN